MELEHFLKNIWCKEYKYKKLNFAKLYNSRLSNLFIPDDIIGMISKNLKY